VIVGGGNSAGQAALFLASRGCEATLAVRGAEIGKSMSAYLVDRVLADPRIEVRLRTEVTGLEGDEVLRAVTLNGAEPHACEALFCFVGAVPETAWLSCLAAAPTGSCEPTPSSSPTISDRAGSSSAAARCHSNAACPACSQLATSGPAR
jgi:thioredoxin reductase (NADPH)